jgi:hypothetical protein
MKNLLFVGIAVLLLFACKTETQEVVSTKSEAVAQPSVDLSRYPEDFKKVLAAHGGLQEWSEMQSLTYTMPKTDGDEVHTIDLPSRKTLIETDKYQMGYDGNDLWLAQDTVYFPKERVGFYYNLMFYFYAMPFVLADDGINYETVEPLKIKTGEFPGIKMSFESNKGNSPDDEYVVYYNPETYQMEWLAYTVTYGKDSKSEKYSYISYSDWQNVNGLKLPAELTWYQLEDGIPTQPAGEPRTFVKVDIDRAPLDEETFEAPNKENIIQ